LLKHHRFETIRHDVTFPLYAELDQIYNLACPASPIHYQRDPVQTTKTSVHGARRFFARSVLRYNSAHFS
jgi:UDP-glucuronate decarboxylase